MLSSPCLGQFSLVILELLPSLHGSAPSESCLPLRGEGRVTVEPLTAREPLTSRNALVGFFRKNEGHQALLKGICINT